MRIITITGMPGSGKSCAARELAAQLSCKWADLDAEVERRAGKSTARIFAEDGEVSFRQLEKDALKGLVGATGQRAKNYGQCPVGQSSEPDLIIALGGGTLQNPVNLELVREHTWCIWLDTPLDIIAERLWAQGDIGARPLLASAKTKKELEELLKSIYESRKPAYQSAAKEVR